MTPMMLAQPRDDIQLASGQLRDVVRAHATGVMAQTQNVLGSQARVEILHDLTSSEIRSLVTAVAEKSTEKFPAPCWRRA